MTRPPPPWRFFAFCLVTSRRYRLIANDARAPKTQVMLHYPFGFTDGMEAMDPRVLANDLIFYTNITSQDG